MKFEYKYLVKAELLPELRALFCPFMELDINMKKGGPSGYTVRSIYFDTLNYNDYYEKINGLKKRKKTRLRGYNYLTPASIVFLETKVKNNKLSSKYRAPVLYDHLKELLKSGNFDQYILTDMGIKNVLDNSRRFLFDIYRHALQPKILIIYEREAFVGKIDHTLRITFDKNIRSSAHPSIDRLFREENIKCTMSGHFVMEVKFVRNFPVWLSTILRTRGLKKQAFSKYTKCIDDHKLLNSSLQQKKLDFIQAVRF